MSWPSGFQFKVRHISGLLLACALIFAIVRVFWVDATTERSSDTSIVEPRGVEVTHTSTKQAPPQNNLLLRVPNGFIVDRVADELGIRFPMFGAFADDGRLFVAESSGLDLHAELKAGLRNSRIRILEDTDGDGQFDQTRTFADKLVCPMGLAWRDGRLYVADPPDVVVFTDDDADGRADRRKVILSKFGHKTNGSLHGLVFGPDGMLYMTMGSPDGYSLKRSDGTVLSGDSGALIRCRPDGAEPEVLCRGFVNLIEIAFTARGDIIGTDNWFRQPDGGLRDALVHLVDGGLYPYLADTGTRYPITGTLLPPVALYPAVALSGLVCYQGPMFPSEMRGNVFTAQFNARKIVRHTLIRHGATFRTTDEDFVTTDDPDFHPSDVIESADGSLILIDTGSWYVQHCPIGRIRDVPAPGGIYRVRYEATSEVDDPWGREVETDRMTPEQLAPLLDDPRPAVRDLAGGALSRRGVDGVSVLASMLKSSTSMVAKQRAIWALAANPEESALVPLRGALEGGDPDIVVPAIRAVASRSDTQSSATLERLLTTGDSFERLAAAEALSRVGNLSVTATLWHALSSDPDPFLEHALVYAAHRLADAAALQQALGHTNFTVEKAALLLLDQPPRPPDALGHAAVVDRLSAKNPELRKMARQVLERHPEWAGHAVGFLRDLLVKPVQSSEDRAAFAQLTLPFLANDQVQQLVATAIRNDGDKFPADRRVQVLELIRHSTIAEIPRAWVDSLAQVVDQAPPEVRLAAVRCAAVLQISELDNRLEQLANSPDEHVELRREALRAVATRRMTLRPVTFELLMDDLASEVDPLLRLAASEVFGKMQLDRDQLLALIHTIKADALITPAVLLPMLERSATPKTEQVVLGYLEESIRGGWRPPRDALKRLLASLSEPARAHLESVLQTAHVNMADLQARLTKFLPLLEGGNAQRGRAVFLSSKVACSTCHRLGTSGGQIGPDLTTIGAVRTGQDLIESIVFPSSTIAQGFEPFTLITTEGRVTSGTMTRQTTDIVVLRDSSGAETRVRRDQIEALDRQPTSMMPEGMERLLTHEELRDLLAFLQSLR